jgi:hypothetical protein
MKLTWRKVLPVLNLIVAIGLLTTGHFQSERHRAAMRQNGVVAEYDYIAPTQVCLTVIDAPAFVLSLPFDLLLKKSRFASQAVFIVVVAAFWYWIGSRLDKRRGNLAPPLKSRIPWLEGIGMVIGIVLLVMAADGFRRGAWPRIIDLSFVLWALVLATLFITQVRISNRRIAHL